MENEVKKEEAKNCNGKCGFGDIVPRIMKFNLGEIITFAAIFLVLVISTLGLISFVAFTTFIFPVGIFTGILFLVFVFAEKFTCFESKHLKLVNSILLGITTIGFIFWTLLQWNFPGGFSIESLIIFILILAANAYWAYDIIMGFVQVQKEMSARKKADEDKEAETKAEETEEKPENKDEEEKEEESEEEEKDDDDEDDDEEKKEE